MRCAAVLCRSRVLAVRSALVLLLLLTFMPMTKTMKLLPCAMVLHIGHLCSKKQTTKAYLCSGMPCWTVCSLCALPLRRMPTVMLMRFLPARDGTACRSPVCEKRTVIACAFATVRPHEQAPRRRVATALFGGVSTPLLRLLSTLTFAYKLEFACRSKLQQTEPASKRRSSSRAALTSAVYARAGNGQTPWSPITNSCRRS